MLQRRENVPVSNSDLRGTARTTKSLLLYLRALKLLTAGNGFPGTGD